MLPINHSADSSHIWYGITYSWLNNASSNFANVNWIIVTTATFGIRVNEGRIFPSLWKAAIVEKDISLLELLFFEKSNDKNETWIWKWRARPWQQQRAYLTKLSLLFVLLDGCEFFVSGDLVLFPARRRDDIRVSAMIRSEQGQRQNNDKPSEVLGGLFVRTL